MSYDQIKTQVFLLDGSCEEGAFFRSQASGLSEGSIGTMRVAGRQIKTVCEHILLAQNLVIFRELDPDVTDFDTRNPVKLAADDERIPIPAHGYSVVEWCDNETGTNPEQVWLTLDLPMDDPNGVGEPLPFAGVLRIRSAEQAIDLLHTLAGHASNVFGEPTKDGDGRDSGRHDPGLLLRAVRDLLQERARAPGPLQGLQEGRPDEPDSASNGG